MQSPAASTGGGPTRRTAPVTLFHTAHQEALVLEVGLVQKLLRANGAAQRRTKYFQRMDMAFRCVVRTHKLLDLFEDYQQLTQDLTEAVTRHQKQKKRAEVFWDFAPLKDGNPATHKNSGSVGVQALVQRMIRIKHGVEKGIPEALSRIEYASEAFFREMARGFFLPLCSVAVAAMARTRVLLQKLGSEILYHWKTLEKSLKEMAGKNAATTAGVIAWDAPTRNALRQILSPLLDDADVETRGTNRQARALLAELMGDRRLLSKLQSQTKLDMDDRSGNGDSIPLEEGTMDIGERVAGHKCIANKDESTPDYMEAAVGHLQNNLALARKAKKKKQKESTAPAGEADNIAEPTIPKTPSSTNPPTNLSAGPVKEKKKKKKRKDASSSKASSKKAKSSGDFFDDLFRK